MSFAPFSLHYSPDTSPSCSPGPPSIELSGSSINLQDSVVPGSPDIVIAQGGGGDLDNPWLASALSPIINDLDLDHFDKKATSVDPYMLERRVPLADIPYASTDDSLHGGLALEFGPVVNFPSTVHPLLEQDDLVKPAMNGCLESYYALLFRTRTAQMREQLTDTRIDLRMRHSIGDNIRIYGEAWRYGFCRHTLLYQDVSNDRIFAERLLRPCAVEIAAHKMIWSRDAQDLNLNDTESALYLKHIPCTFVQRSACIRISGKGLVQRLHELATSTCMADINAHDKLTMLLPLGTDFAHACLECQWRGRAIFRCTVCMLDSPSVEWTGLGAACIGFGRDCYLRAKDPKKGSSSSYKEELLRRVLF